MGRILSGEDVTRMFQEYGKELGRAVRAHSVLTPFMTKNFSGLRANDLIRNAVAYLVETEGYVYDTVPLLKAGGKALEKGKKKDEAFSKAYKEDAEEETDKKGGYGHNQWARDDREHLLKALPPEVAAALGAIRPSRLATDGLYHQHMVVEVAKHPYGGLGAKGVLEHLAVDISTPCVEGMRMALPNVSKTPTENWRKDHGVTFLRQHGVLDLLHTESGNLNLEQRMQDPEKLRQIAAGAEITRAFYHGLLFAMEEKAQRYKAIMDQLGL